jgi:hypothetical protein
MPKFFSKIATKNKNALNYSHTNTMLLGASTFFLPCGFTQAMQVYAVTTGSFVSGALIMGVFALGTTPGLLGIGGIVSYLRKGYLSRLFFKFIGVLIIVLSIYNVSTGLNLAGLRFNFSQNKNNQTQTQTQTESNGVQLLKATYTPEKNNLTPNKFTTRVGQPTRLEVFDEEYGVGCMGSVMIPGLVSQPKFYLKGETAVFEFTPKKAGVYPITCAMGIKSAEIVVE